MKNSRNKIEVLFVTGNQNKFEDFSKITSDIFNVKQITLDIPEIQGDPIEVAKTKSKHAFKLTKKSVITEDTSLMLNSYGGLPGVYVKSFLEKIGPMGIYKMTSVFEDKSATVQCLFCYSFSEIEDPIIFVGQMKGEIVEPSGENNYGFDPCFKPEGFDKTYGEMTNSEKNGISHYYKALNIMKKYFEENIK